MSAVAEQPSSSMTDFQRRMRGLVKRNNNNSNDGARRRIGRGSGSSATRNNDQRPTNLKLVHTLEEYKEVLDEHKDKMVVVRFFATWCKACKAIQPSYYRMASLYPHIIFLEVPVTNDNVNLHQGLEVPSLPYGHIYYPNAGLVEEMKISKKYFHNLVKCVRWYDVGECELSEMEATTAAAAEWGWVNYGLRGVGGGAFRQPACTPKPYNTEVKDLRTEVQVMGGANLYEWELQQLKNKLCFVRLM